LHHFEFDDAGLTGLTDLDLFGARITDVGTNYLKSMQHGSEVFVYCKVIISVDILTTFMWFSYIVWPLTYFCLLLYKKAEICWYVVCFIMHELHFIRM